MKIFILQSAFVLLCTGGAFAVTLQWDIPLNERLELTRTASVEYSVNDKPEKLYEERNVIDLTCNRRDGLISYVKGVFSIFQRETANEVFNLREQYNSEFGIGPSGKYIIGAHNYMPNLRHIPTFPPKDVTKGDMWQAPGSLVLNNFSRPFSLNFSVSYRLDSVENRGDIQVAVIYYDFSIDKSMTGGKYPPDFPSLIKGGNTGSIIWDVKKNRPLYMDETYKIEFGFQMQNEALIKHGFIMKIHTAVKMYQPVSKDEEEKARADIAKELPSGKGVDVDVNKRGLVVRLGEVLFDFDSAVLKKDARNTINAIIDILKQKYPDRELIVEGHTDNEGSRQYNKSLSERRAESVAKYLRERSEFDKLSYRGLGQDEPIADNGTKEGRKKNRRVEIIIKLR